MSLASGTRLGPYEIVGALGAGGMGEVYRARDTRLDRTVALKVLPDLFASDPERLARFEREAKTLAALNHPHIAQVYGLEQAGGVHALAMELVEGEDLATRLSRGRLSWPEALPIARQIADALEAAHEKGIIHRDLKPANIALTADGQVKVLDFGLAKALERPSDGGDALNSPTITSPAAMTAAGMVLGTAAYMSPEQAHGRAADKRSDVWAFGCVLYEMLTGRRAFPGDDVIDTLASVVKGEPDWNAWPAGVPPPIRLLAQQCLVKDRRERVSDIAAVRYVLQQTGSGLLVQPVALERKPRSSQVRWYAAIAAILIVNAAVLTVGVLRRAFEPRPPAPVARLSIAPSGDFAVITTGVERDLALVPDGSGVVYRTRTGQLAIRSIDQIAPMFLENTEGARSPFVSPDGQWVGFWTRGMWKKVPITGGAAVDIGAATGGPRGVAWGSDNRIVFADTETPGLRMVSAAGGEPEVVTTFAPEEQGHLWPSFMPDGRAVLFTITARAIDRPQIAVLDLHTRERKVLTTGTHPFYVEPGYLVFRLGEKLMAVPFARERLALTGTPAPLIEQVAGTPAGAVNAAVAANGTLAYIPGAIRAAERMLVWVDRTGHVTPTKLPTKAYVFPRLSPDDTRVAVDARDQEQDIWIGDLGRHTLTRLTFGPALEQYPIWMPDGQRVVFSSSRDGVMAAYRQAADGTGAVARLIAGAAGEGTPTAATPDGRQLVMRSGNHIGLMTIEGSRGLETLVRETSAVESNGEISPDGRWVLYESNQSGRPEVYVRPFPRANDGRWQVSTDGGVKPLWARNGRELFYLEPGGSFMAVSVEQGSAFSAGAPRKLFDASPFFVFTPSVRSWDVAADGRFMFVQENLGSASAAPLEIVVVLNWHEELKARVPIPR